MHNSIPTVLRAGFRFGWSRAGRGLGRVLARHGRTKVPGTGSGTGGPVVNWKRSGGPWFGNQLMTLRLRGRSAELTLEQARAVPEGADSPGGVPGAGRGIRSRLEQVLRRPLVDAQAPPESADGPSRGGS